MIAQLPTTTLVTDAAGGVHPTMSGNGGIWVTVVAVSVAPAVPDEALPGLFGEPVSDVLISATQECFL